MGALAKASSASWVTNPGITLPTEQPKSCPSTLLHTTPDQTPEVASSVHIIARARELAEGADASEGGVMDTSTSLAVLVAQLNTVAAFTTLAISDHQGLYSMGVLLGLAIFFVLIASLVLLPALLIALERRRTASLT